jgi:hypothetical protein
MSQPQDGPVRKHQKKMATRQLAAWRAAQAEKAGGSTQPAKAAAAKPAAAKPAAAKPAAAKPAAAKPAAKA